MSEQNQKPEGDKPPEQKAIEPHVVTAQPKPDDEVDFGPFLKYLQSQQGHEVVGRVLTMIEGLKKFTESRLHAHSVLDQWLKFAVIGIIIGAIVVLSVTGKMDATVGTMLGTAAGYFFGRAK